MVIVSKFIKVNFTTGRNEQGQFIKGFSPPSEWFTNRIAWNKGISPSLESIKKMVGVRKKKGNYVAWNKGLKGGTSWNKGKHFSEESKRKMSEGHKNSNYVHSLETRKKMSESKKGGKAPFWRGGITPINHIIRQSLEYRLWREAVFARDNYICQKCGQLGGNLEADHIKRFSEYPELRFAIDNGQTLCKACHKTTDTWGTKGLKGRQYHYVNEYATD
ncbi:MAG: HNH endonuclease domain protein [Parcubacteria group bacterium GW2011_GWB1_40_14]|nr:MAG: HNH endonuclease domain protein [Parcubacteria group bacterium GW2011_GWB1_40_14]